MRVEILRARVGAKNKKVECNVLSLSKVKWPMFPILAGSA
jgi:hypothetical protein